MSNTQIIPVILCGGSGTRLWPLSRNLYPKQFQSLIGEYTLLQATLQRLNGLADCDEMLVVCNEEHRFIVSDQAKACGIESVTTLLEPVGRNTAPATAIAALAKRKEDPVLMVLPADHVIKNEQAFIESVKAAVDWAQQGKLVTFGIQPQNPATGYGYIRRGASLSRHDAQACFAVDAFAEKPDALRANEYVESGDYFWNSGMFAFKANRYLQELSKFEPDLLASCESAYKKSEIDSDLKFVRIEEQSFRGCKDISIDYAVMERTKEAVMIPTNVGWSDVGSWQGFWEVADKDNDGNILVGDALAYDVQDSLLKSDGKLLVAMGLDNIVVVDTDDVTLVADKDKSENIKQVVNDLKRRQRSETEAHVEVHRPWGSFKGMEQTGYYQVKKLVLKPGAKISLQLHHKRSEHWVVVKGVAKVVRGDDILTLNKDESTFIPVGTKHQLENIGDEDLEVIEVQTGTYFGEDDIVRFDDIYGRV